MVNEVETVLREIRERVIAENKSALPAAAISSESKPAELSLQIDSGAPASLERLAAQLAITARAWDRLPPLVSNRRGALARIEIWIKKIFRSLTRWFTWEQVNFNAATHHAFLEASTALRAQQESLKVLEQRAVEVSAYLSQVDATLKRHSEMMSDLAAELRKGHQNLSNEMHRRFPEMASSIDGALQKFARDMDARMAEVSAEFREEQRVCFKQLSLETSEAAVLEDRGRRSLEARIEGLEAAVRRGDQT
jgi:hypothetical protein